MRGIKDKAVMVTGGAGGIGSAICTRFAELGATVAIVDNSGDRAESLAETLIAQGGRAHALPLDITDYDRVATVVEGFEATAQKIDVLVHAAGWDRAACSFLQTEPQDWEQVIDVNLRGSLNILHTVARSMSTRGCGRIINIASDAARSGAAFQPVYAACKSGLIALTKSLAVELARFNITVNAVCPGVIRTEMMQAVYGQDGMAEKLEQKTLKTIPLRRFGEPGDITGQVLFFASEEAGYVTGQTISISGGLTMIG